MTISKCQIIELPVLEDHRGKLSYIESEKQVPFKIERVYYLYDVPDESKRGSHAHKDLQQLIIPIAGSFDVILDDGNQKKHYHLDSPNRGLYICPMIWRVLENFSPGSVCMVFASRHYDETDYLHDYEEFITTIQATR